VLEEVNKAHASTFLIFAGLKANLAKASAALTATGDGGEEVCVATIN
jgi:hypothetical protein